MSNDDCFNDLTRKVDRIISLLEVLVIQNERGTYAYGDEEEDDSRAVPPILLPVVPVFPMPDTRQICAKCGVKFEGVTGYSCQQLVCPMGVGSVAC